MNSFKILRLRIFDNYIFKDFDVSLYDLTDKPKEPYTTLIIGPNGTGKSNLLRFIILLFSELNEFKITGKRNGKINGKFNLEYEYNGKIFSYLNYNFNEELPYQPKKDLKPQIWIDNAISTHNHIEIPNSVIALSVMLTDKFPTEIQDFEQYVYLGVKINSNTARTSSFVTKTINLLYESISDEKVFKNLTKGLAFLEYENELNVSYYPRYKHIFFKGQLTEKKFEQFFTNFWEYTKRDKENPPWSLNTFKRIKERSPDKIIKLVDLCNRISSILEYEYEGSRTQYFEFNVLDNQFSIVDLKLIKDLHSLDLISYPSIGFRKKGNYFQLSESSSGEYHFISGFIGLLAKIKPNSLILIDEPENSLHPNWQMKYISFLKSVFRDFKDCHFIITSHSHFMVSDLSNSSSCIVGLNKGENISAEKIPSDTYGWSAEEILLKIFKTPSSRNYYLTEKLGQVFELISKKPTQKSFDEITKNVDELKKLDLSGLNDEDPLKDVIKKLFQKF